MEEVIEPKLVMCPYCKGAGKLDCEIQHPSKLLLIRALNDIKIAKRLMPYKMVCPNCKGTGRA